MYEIASLRDDALDRQRIERHVNQVQAEFAVELERHLLRQGERLEGDARFLSTVAAQCVAAATFAAVNAWMSGEHSDLDELSRLTVLALSLVERGLSTFTPAVEI